MENQATASKERALRKVVVVFKTHFDLGFTGLPDEVMGLYTGQMFNQVREVVAATAGEPEGLRYNWTLPAWPMKQLLHDPRLPEETRRAARNLVEQGSLSWHAWPFTTHTAFCSLEELVRGLHISRSLSEEFGRWPSGAKQTDVPGHTWIFPSLLVSAGIKFLHLGCNSGSHAPHVPRLFWWEGPDGARLLTWYSPGGYGTPLLPPEDWPLDTWLAVQQTVDNVGPHSPEELRRIRETITQGAPDTEIVFGELGDFADSLLEHPEQLEYLPVVPYDLADTWIHGIGTMPREVARVRALRAKLLTLESIAACFSWPASNLPENADRLDLALPRHIAPLIDEAYEQLLLFGEHTWGLDVKSTIKRSFGDEFEAARQTEPYLRLEASWAAKAEYVSRAENAYAKALEVVRKSWRGRLDSPAVQENSARIHELLGENIDAPRTIESPELNYAVAPTSANVLELGEFRIEVDPVSGGLISFKDEERGREWINSAHSEPFGGYRYDIYSATDIAEFMRAYGLYFQDWFVQDFGKQGYPEDTPHVTAYARDFEISREHSEDGESLLLRGGQLKATGPGAEFLPPQSISIRISMFSGGVSLDYTIEGKKATHLAESTVAAFPLNLPKAAFRLGQMGSVIDPARDIAEGANRSLWCADWVDASDDRVGMAIVPIDMPLVSVGDTGIYKFGPKRVPTDPVIYAHLSNTQWGTNFPQWLEGDFNFRVTVAPHTGDWRTGKVWSRIPHIDPWELQLDGETEGVAGLWLELPNGIVLQGVRPRHDGPGLIVRCWDALGIARPDLIRFWGPIAHVWRCDLMERPMDELKSWPRTDTGRGQHMSITAEIAPHAIETILIEFDSK
jgi:alpha-mannosidase